MQLTFLGACREVGRAAILIEENRKRLVLDYGIKISPEENTLPIPVQGFLDAVIVSHAHLDHSGAVPMLYKNSEQPCYITPPSLPLINLLVEDSIKVNKLKGLKPIFSKKHVRRMLRNIIPVPYSRETKTNGINFKFEDAGHILGAASTQIDIEKYRLVYTGDIKFEKTRLHSPGFDNYKDVDILITESTYGNRIHTDRKETEKKFVEDCWEVCDNNGNVLVPAFAVGRSHEVISILSAHGFDYPIYMDGMAKGAAEIIFDFPNYVRDFRETYKALKNAYWVSKPHHRKEALEKPSVIVSTAGMLGGGPAVNYLFKMREIPKSAVFLSGYQPKNTPGYNLLESKRFKFEGFDFDFSNFRIEFFDFSAHADSEGLRKFAKKCDPKICFVIHGDDEQSSTLAKNIEKDVGCKTIVPKLGDKFDVDKYL